MELKDIVFGPKNPAPLSDPLTITLVFKTVDTSKQFKLELIADVTNTRHIASVPPTNHVMNDKGELIWNIQGGLISNFKGSAGMIRVEDVQGSWRCNCIVMVQNGERTVLSPLE